MYRNKSGLLLYRNGVWELHLRLKKWVAWNHKVARRHLYLGLKLISKTLKGKEHSSNSWPTEQVTVSYRVHLLPKSTMEPILPKSKPITSSKLFVLELHDGNYCWEWWNVSFQFNSIFFSGVPGIDHSWGEPIGKPKRASVSWINVLWCLYVYILKQCKHHKNQWELPNLNAMFKAWESSHIKWSQFV